MEGFRRFSFDKGLFASTLALVSIGLLMVFSASGNLASDRHGQAFYFLIHQALGALMGLALIFVIAAIRRPFFQSAVFVYGLLAASAALLALCFVMPPVAHTNRWVQLFGLRFQPSELAKISLVLFLAYYCDLKKERLREWRTLVVPLGVVLGILVLILKEPNLGTALFVAALAGLMLFLGGVRVRVFVVLGLLLLVVVGLSLSRTSYQMDRLQSFLDPHQDPLKEGFQVNQSKLAVGSGGLLGVSLGYSRQKLYFLPFAHTDFIYAILGEEFGLVGASLVLVLFIVFLWRGLRVSFNAQNPLHRMIAAGLTFLITAQALLNITVVLGIGPVTGIPLPFLSYGRSSLLCSLIAVGLILNISERRPDRAGVKA